MPRDTNDKKLNRKNPYLNEGALIGESFATYNINTEMGRNAQSITIVHDGGSGTDGEIQLSYDGTDWSSTFPLRAGESFQFDQVDVHSLRVIRTASGGDFIFRVVAL